jgi:hypothetical protein
MINLLPQCIKCGSPVTDSLEAEIEEHGKIKTGSYIKGVWTCNDCIIAAATQGKENEEEEEEQQDTIGVASKSDVSPNTPRADEAGG